MTSVIIGINLMIITSIIISLSLEISKSPFLTRLLSLIICLLANMFLILRLLLKKIRYLTFLIDKERRLFKKVISGEGSPIEASSRDFSLNSSVASSLQDFVSLIEDENEVAITFR